jgi:hypothetical protein
VLSSTGFESEGSFSERRFYVLAQKAKDLVSRKELLLPFIFVLVLPSSSFFLNSVNKIMQYL